MKRFGESMRGTPAGRFGSVNSPRSLERRCGRSSARRDLAVFVSSPRPAQTRARPHVGRHDRAVAHGHCGTLTSTIRGVRSEVVVGPEAGLKHPSAINLHHIVTVPTAGLRVRVGHVSDEVMEQVRDALLFALGFIAPR